MPEFNEGDHVIYRPNRQFTWTDHLDERGVVVLPAGQSKETSNGGHVVAGPNYTFVRYGNDEQVKATRTEDLVLEHREGVFAESLTERVVLLPTNAPDAATISYPVDTGEDETFVNAITPAITTVVGEVGFHIDPQARNALRKAYEAGFDRARNLSEFDTFDEWVEAYIEDHERITSD